MSFYLNFRFYFVSGSSNNGTKRFVPNYTTVSCFRQCVFVPKFPHFRNLLIWRCRKCLCLPGLQTGWVAPDPKWVPYANFYFDLVLDPSSMVTAFPRMLFPTSGSPCQFIAPFYLLGSRFVVVVFDTSWIRSSSGINFLRARSNASTMHDRNSFWCST